MFSKISQSLQEKIKPATLLKKETKESVAQIFSCKFCESFKNNFVTEATARDNLGTTASGAFLQKKLAF